MVRYGSPCLIAAFLLAIMSGGSYAQRPRVGMIVGLRGSCEKLVLAGRAAKCHPGSGLIYAHLPNGHVMLSFALADGRVAAFVGETDTQPQPEAYYLYLSRFRANSKGSAYVINVGGQCVIRMSLDGSVWSTINCDATDENGASYAFHFQTDGKPIHPANASAAAVTARSSPVHVALPTVARVAATFKRTMAASGMNGVNQSVQRCFDEAGTSNVSAIRACMLYDIAEYRLDRAMQVVFEARGWHPVQNSYLTERAFGARMRIYSSIAFGGSEAAAYRFFGNAPDDVVAAVSK